VVDIGSPTFDGIVVIDEVFPLDEMMNEFKSKAQTNEQLANHSLSFQASQRLKTNTHR
jgi:hypothetical protein